MEENKKVTEEEAKEQRYEYDRRRSHEITNRRGEIKIKTMEILYEQLELLAKDSTILEGNERHNVVKIMAMLGQAILPN